LGLQGTAQHGTAWHSMESSTVLLIRNGPLALSQLEACKPS
jgi:hypothetical protein